MTPLKSLYLIRTPDPSSTDVRQPMGIRLGIHERHKQSLSPYLRGLKPYCSTPGAPRFKGSQKCGPFSFLAEPAMLAANTGEHRSR